MEGDLNLTEMLLMALVAMAGVLVGAIAWAVRKGLSGLEEMAAKSENKYDDELVKILRRGLQKGLSDEPPAT